MFALVLLFVACDGAAGHPASRIAALEKKVASLEVENTEMMSDTLLLERKVAELTEQVRSLKPQLPAIPHGEEEP